MTIPEIQDAIINLKVAMWRAGCKQPLLTFYICCDCNFVLHLSCSNRTFQPVVSSDPEAMIADAYRQIQPQAVAA